VQIKDINFPDNKITDIIIPDNTLTDTIIPYTILSDIIIPDNRDITLPYNTDTLPFQISHRHYISRQHSDRY